MSAESVDSYGSGVARLTPDAVRHLTLPRTPLGRRGYAEAEVDRFRLIVADELGRADAEKAELRAEIDRLRNYFRSQRISPETGQEQGEPSLPIPAAPPAEIVNLMSAAQQAADQYIADAEAYTRRLIADARRQHEEIVLAARVRADQAAEEATHAFRSTTAPAQQTAEQAELEGRIAYLRTFTDVTQVQMRSILTALSQELDRLREFGTATGRPALEPATTTGPTDART